MQSKYAKHAKKQENITHNGKKNQPKKADPEMT